MLFNLNCETQSQFGRTKEESRQQTQRAKNSLSDRTHYQSTINIESCFVGYRTAVIDVMNPHKTKKNRKIFWQVFKNFEKSTLFAEKTLSKNVSFRVLEKNSVKTCEGRKKVFTCHSIFGQRQFFFSKIFAQQWL